MTPARGTSTIIGSSYPSLFLFGLLSPLWRFSTLVTYYFNQFEGDFALHKNDLNYRDRYHIHYTGLPVFHTRASRSMNGGQYLLEPVTPLALPLSLKNV